MLLLRLVGFTTLSCGCLVGRYREVAVNREVHYIEEKGGGCWSADHQRNHLVAGEAPQAPAVAVAAAVHA